MKKFLSLFFLCLSVCTVFSQDETAIARLKNFTITNIPSQLVFVTKDEVNIREEASLNAPRMEQNFGLGYYLAYRGVYKCLGSRNGWYNIIVPPTTLDGWVSGSLAKPVSNKPIDWNEVKNKAYKMFGGYVRVAKHQETGLALMEFRSIGNYNTPIYTDLYLGKQVNPGLLVFFQPKSIYSKQAGYDYAKDAAFRNYGENHQVWVQADAKEGGWSSFDLETIPSSLLLRIMGAPEREIEAEFSCEFVTSDVLTSTTAMMVQKPAKVPTLTIDTLECELSEYDGYLSLNLSVEYPISGPERMVCTLRDTILNDICQARSFVVEDIRKDEIARSWDELPGLLWKSLNEDWKELEEDYIGDKEDMNPYNLEVSLNCTSSTESFATFKLITGIWPMGAAHPHYVVSLYTVDATSGHLLTPNDIFRNPESEKLEELIYQELCRQNEGIEEELEEDYDEAVPLSDYKGVALLPKGVFIQYNPYEIGSYSLGAPECILPIAKVRHLLTPYALRLLEKK